MSVHFPVHHLTHSGNIRCTIQYILPWNNSSGTSFNTLHTLQCIVPAFNTSDVLDDVLHVVLDTSISNTSYISAQLRLLIFLGPTSDSESVARCTVTRTSAAQKLDRNNRPGLTLPGRTRPWIHSSNTASATLEAFFALGGVCEVTSYGFVVFPKGSVPRTIWASVWFHYSTEAAIVLHARCWLWPRLYQQGNEWYLRDS
jgi:hypothetical protein